MVDNIARSDVTSAPFAQTYHEHVSLLRKTAFGTFSDKLSFIVQTDQINFKAVFWCSSSSNFILSSFIRSEFDKLQSNLDISNTDGSFIMAHSNSIFSPYDVLR